MTPFGKTRFSQPPVPAWKKSLWGAAALLLLLQAFGCSPDRAVEAGSVLADLAAGGGPSRLKESTPRPRRTAIRFTTGDRLYEGDLYQPRETAWGSVLLVPGAAEEGRSDPRLVAFAETLARARFTVLVPDLVDLRELRTGPGNIAQVRDIFFWLESTRGDDGGKPAGIVAFSYAAGPVILAALDPGIRDRVDFILAVGPYFDLPDTLTFFTTGYFRTPAGWQHLAPNAYGKWVFVLSNLHRLSDPEDRELFRAMAERKKQNLAAVLDDLAVGLSAEGRSLFDFVTNRDPDRAPWLLKRLPRGILDDIRALDLASRDLSPLHARLYLLHGYHDPIIPFVQSLALARAAPASRTRLFLLESLDHVEIRPATADRLSLWRAVYLLLGERGED